MAIGTRQEVTIRIKAEWKVQSNLSGQAPSHESKKNDILPAMT